MKFFKKYFLLLSASAAILSFSTALAAGNDSNTLSLLHFNGNFANSAAGGSSYWATNGNAAVNYSEKKFGSGSLEIEDSGDYLSSEQTEITTGDLTIDGWFFLNSIGTYNSYIAFPNGQAFGIKDDGTCSVYFFDGDTFAITGSCPSIGEWHHIALRRNSGVATLDLDGISQGSSAWPDDLLGTWKLGSDGGSHIFGYIDEFRVSNIDRWNTPDFALSSGEYSSGEIPAPPANALSFSLGENAGADIGTTVSGLISSVWVLIALVLGVPLAFYIIKKLVTVLPKDVSYLKDKKK